MILQDPDRANLLAMMMYRLLRPVTKPLPRGKLLIRAGQMKARLVVEDQAYCISGDGPADCVIEGSLALLTSILTGEGGYLKAWWQRKLVVKGQCWKAWQLLRALR